MKIAVLSDVRAKSEISRPPQESGMDGFSRQQATGKCSWIISAALITPETVIFPK